jgi:hypothetical protein
VTFDDLPDEEGPLDGQYPAGMIDWGANSWYLSGPWGLFTTKSVSFDGPGITSASFTLLSPRRLVRFDVYNGGSTAATLTISCAGQPTRQTVVSAGLVAAFDTGWTDTCTAVTFGVTNGWDTNFDNLAFDVPTSQQVVVFDDIPGQNQPLDGQYPAGLIDWGSGNWWLSGPYGRFTTKSVSFTSSRTDAGFTFTAPKGLVRLDIYNGGPTASTVTIGCAGQPTVQTVVAPDQLVTVNTGWSGACTAVTLASTNGWLTNFDNLVVSG